MWAWLYLALFAFATYWTHMWLIRKDEIFVTGLIATASWLYLAYSGATLRFVAESGEPNEIIGPGAFQLFCFGMAVLSLLGGVVGNYFGWFPTDDATERGRDRSEIPSEFRTP